MSPCLREISKERLRGQQHGFAVLCGPEIADQRPRWEGSRVRTVLTGRRRVDKARFRHARTIGGVYRDAITDWRSGLRTSGRRLINSRHPRSFHGLAEPVDETVGLYLGNLTPAIGALLKVVAYDLDRNVIEFTQGVSPLGLRRRMRGGLGVHKGNLPLRVAPTIRARLKHKDVSELAYLQRKPKSYQTIAGAVRLEYSTIGWIGVLSARTVAPCAASEHSSM